MTSTTTSEVMTVASVACAIGPCARVCDSTPSVADGLRVTETTPHISETPAMIVHGTPCKKRQKGDSAQKSAAVRQEHEQALEQGRPGQRARAVAQVGDAQLGAARERDERQRQRVGLASCSTVFSSMS